MSGFVGLYTIRPRSDSRRWLCVGYKLKGPMGPGRLHRFWDSGDLFSLVC